ncbi:MAG: group I truncated hemoglobin [Pseudomonadota bacterium]
MDSGSILHRHRHQRSITTTWVVAGLLLLTACVSSSREQNLFEALGGHTGVEQIVDNFIIEIANDPRVLPRFEDSNVERFRDKITEHFCMITDGPCEYTGDTMVRVHAGMQISSAEFNAVVEDLMDAMDEAGTPVSAQNRLLARLARLRPDIIRI